MNYLIIIIIVIIIIVSIVVTLFLVKDKFSNEDENIIKLFHWNIHYNCFTKDNGNCDFKHRDNKKQNIKQFIMEKHFKNVDFANLIMFEEDQVKDNKYKLKKPSIKNINCDTNCEYLSLVQYCGKNKLPLNLVYNSKKWKLVDNVNTCINTNSNISDHDRPSIIGKFKSKKNSNIIVFVICIYMQHPWDLDPMKSIDVLNDSLIQLKFNKDKDKLIFMSDTNLLGSEDNAQNFKDINDERANNMSLQQYFINEYIANQLTNIPIKNREYFTSKNIKTCCNDNTGFKYDYDRIFVNFGELRLTTIIPNNELEKPIKPKHHDDLKVPYTNQMHRPLLISISY